VYCTVASGWQTGGGTSAAAPLFAGELALADEAAAQHDEAPIGLANPLLYRLGEAHSPALREITIGNNDVYGLGCCKAQPGYNEPAGWGSPDVPALIVAADLAGK
jgi:subtilase family serine protease